MAMIADYDESGRSHAAARAYHFPKYWFSLDTRWLLYQVRLVGYLLVRMR